MNHREFLKPNLTKVIITVISAIILAILVQAIGVAVFNFSVWVKGGCMPRSGPPYLESCIFYPWYKTIRYESFLLFLLLVPLYLFACFIASNKLKIKIFILSILGLILGVVLFLVGYELVQKQLYRPPTEAVTTIPILGETANWKTYRSSKCGIEFQYPPQYKVVEQTLETLGRGCVQLQIPYRPKGQVFDLMIDFYRHLTFPTEDVEKCKGGEDITKGCAIDVKIGGVNGIEYNYGDMYRVIKVKNPELQINMNGGIFSRFYEEREKVNKIISSFKFTN